jgi:hypothetical protein
LESPVCVKPIVERREKCALSASAGLHRIEIYVSSIIRFLPRAPIFSKTWSGFSLSAKIGADNFVNGLTLRVQPTDEYRVWGPGGRRFKSCLIYPLDSKALLDSPPNSPTAALVLLWCNKRCNCDDTRSTARRRSPGAFGNLIWPHRGHFIWPHLLHKNPSPLASIPRTAGS